MPAARLNQDCFCIDVDAGEVWRRLEGSAPVQALKAEREHLFSNGPAFVSADDLAAMEATVRAIEAVAELPAYREAALAWAPAIARHDLGPRGAFMGYDFHLTADGPRLIEVNTNAGGAFLNALLAQGQVCCGAVRDETAAVRFARFEDAAWEMFVAEWRRQGREGAPATVAIVDEAPEGQYLYPEFLLAQAFFARRGVAAVIVDPKELSFEGARLIARGAPVDLVYNRLTDFGFERPETAALRAAYLSGAVVVTPNPRNHALLADKRDLTLLSDRERLAAWDVPADTRLAIERIPETRPVTRDNAEDLWSRRKALFFKPAAGHAGKAVYRGDKLTRGVWETIVAGGYVAQDLAPPSERRVRVQGEPQARKMDVRLYTYAGETLLAAARLYQGQTTNFRTPGGGFAPVVVVTAEQGGRAAA